MKKQKGTINLIKLLMSVGILLMHTGMEFSHSGFLGTWIFVEWFYMFAGYCVTKEVVEKTWNTDSNEAGEITFGILKKRICSIYPYFFISCILGLLIQLLSGSIKIGSVNDIAPYASEFLMLQMTGLNLYCRGLVGTTWFLSSMWIALALLIPCIMKMKKYFVWILSLLIPLLIYGYIDITTGYLWSPGSWVGFAAKGTLRAVAALCLGSFSYGLGEKLRDKLVHPKAESAAIYVLYGLVFLYTWRCDDSKWYYLIPLMFTVLIAVSMVKKQGFDVPDTKLTRIMGRISMLLFINHVYIIYAIQSAFPQWSTVLKILVTVLASGICIAISYSGGELIKRKCRGK